MSRREVLARSFLVAALTTAFLVPFLDKAYHIDDPLFVWAGQHIQRAPWDFYGFQVNWYLYEEPMHVVMKNPPLAAYLHAATSSLLGWNEPALHGAMLVFAILATLGTFALAARFEVAPLLATSAAVLTPVFVVSGTQVMCDMLLLALWVWSLYLWAVGLERDSAPCLAAGVVLAGGAFLAKYFGLALLGLLIVEWAGRSDRRWRHLPWLVVPLAVVIGYEAWTYSLYGKCLFMDASFYSTSGKTANPLKLMRETATNFAFVGGCLVSAPLIRILTSARALAYGILAAGCSSLLLIVMDPVVMFGIRDEAGINWSLVAQWSLLASAGGYVLWLAGEEWWRRRDRLSVLLACWLFGTFAFVACLNWSVTARNLLPAAPAVGMLAARRFGQIHDGRRLGIGAALVLSGALSFAVAWSDAERADADRRAAGILVERVRAATGVEPPSILFQGHWGFQYYLEQLGCVPLNYGKIVIHPGQIVLMPLDNTNVLNLPPEKVKLIDTLLLDSFPILTTSSRPLSAGFYSSSVGKLPFAFGKVPPREYLVLRFVDGLYYWRRQDRSG